MSRGNQMSRRFFVAGVVVQCVTACAHLLSFLSTPEPKNETERQFFDTFQNYRFPIPGGTRAMSELMTGFSAHFSISMFALAILGFVLWRWCGRERTPALTPYRQFAVVMAVSMVAITINSQVFFFVVPTVCLGLAALCFVVSAITAKA